MDYTLALVDASQDLGQVTIPVGTDDEIDVREIEELLPSSFATSRHAEPDVAAFELVLVELTDPAD